MGFTSIDEFIKFLSPSGLQASDSSSKTQPKPVRQHVQELIMDPRGKFVTYLNLHNEITNYIKDKEQEKTDLSLEMHAMGSNKPNRIDLNDADYWGENVNSLKDFLIEDEFQAAINPEFQSSVFAIRSPYIDPSTRGTAQIDFFLNNTPPIVASRMQPYLDVEFELRRNSSDTIETPTLMRFIIGSAKLDGSSSGPDQRIEMSSVFRRISQKDSTNSTVAFSGMEMFLSPQTLTNMTDEDGVYALNKGGNQIRLVKQKPFVPFASVESLDVSVQNAGAGKFSHKTASLKLKIHDKARLSEFATFIRPQGFHDAIIWTTYGWIAPLDNDDDDFCKFINDNMLMRECWSVVNTQFGFDGSGQAQMTLSLMSKGARMMQDIYVLPNRNIRAALSGFHSAIQEVHKFIEKNSGNKKFALGAVAMQVLNAGGTTGKFEGFEQDQITKAIKSISDTFKGNFGEKEVENLTTALKDLNVIYSYESLGNQFQNSVTAIFNRFGKTPDPFLPKDETKEKYWDPRLLASIKSFDQTLAERKASQQEKLKKAKQGQTKKNIKDTIINISEKKSAVVSFGKIFLSLVLPAVKASLKCDELQVYFYAINDQCGPVSGCSIAEFPIDVEVLVRAYVDALKAAMTDALSVETFLRIAIETQFTDQRAIGYARHRYFKPVDSSKPNEAEQKDGTKKGKDNTSEADGAEKGLNEWSSVYGDWRPPMIEMIIETGIEGESKKDIVKNLKRGALLMEQDMQAGTPSDGRVISRIHIYDKQNNPYKLAQSIIHAGNGMFEVGHINEGKIRARVLQLVEGKSKEQLETLKNLISRAKEADPDAAAKTFINAVDVVQRPGGPRVTMKVDRKTVADQLKKFVPSITVGSNGTMVTSANVASKTDGLQGSVNIIRSVKGFSSGKPTTSGDGLQDSNGLPLTIVPVQLNMSTFGVPTMNLYQNFFVDFGTGTNIDNIYACNTIQHSISPGKFNSNLSFIYSSGYPKFGNPPVLNTIISGQLDNILNDAIAAASDKKKQGNKGKPGKGK